MSCGPLPGEAIAPVRALRGNRAVIEGVVVRDGELLPGAYVRLLDALGEFVAEVQTDWAGRFRFYCTAGKWTLRSIAVGSEPTDVTAEVVASETCRVQIEA